MKKGNVVSFADGSQYLVTKVVSGGVYGKRCNAEEHAEGADLGGRWERFLGGVTSLMGGEFGAKVFSSEGELESKVVPYRYRLPLHLNERFVVWPVSDLSKPIASFERLSEAKAFVAKLLKMTGQEDLKIVDTTTGEQVTR